MRKTLFILILTLLITGCGQADRKLGLPRIAIAGLAIESSTFSPALTHEEAFHAKTGEDLFSIYPFLSKDSLVRKSATWFPTLKGHALPGGMVTREAYESLVGKTLNLLAENAPYDGLFLDIHGAMSVEGLDSGPHSIARRKDQHTNRTGKKSLCKGGSGDPTGRGS